MGQPVKLRPFQKKDMKKLYDTPTRQMIISFAKKNGKTGLAAMLLLLHLVGPEAKANSQLFSSAQSIDQAAITFNLGAKMVRMSQELSQHIIVRDHKKELACPELGTLYRALSAEVKTSHGLSPIFVIHDELGQVQGPRSDLYDSLEFGMSAHDNPLSVVISTQAPTDNDLLSILIDDAQTNEDHTIKLSLYTSDPEADPFSVKTIKAANPAFGDFQNASEVLKKAEDARRIPSKESSYRNLILNQRVETSNPFVPISIWKANGGEVDMDWGTREVYGGLDLSETTDLTSLQLICKVDGLWQVRPYFWLPEVGLREKARADRVPYDLWHDQGYLETTPGKSISYSYVAKLIVELRDQYNLITIGFDRWNMRHFTPWLKDAGMEEEEIEQLFEEFGQGYASMSPALSQFEILLLNEQMRHGSHPVLNMCAANAVVKIDEARNRKLDKKRSRGRIDGMVALAMAVGVANIGVEEDETEIEYVSGQMYGR